MSDVPHWTEFPKHRPPCWHSDFRGLSLLVYPNPTYDWVWEVSHPPPVNGTLGKGPAENLEQARDRAEHFAYGWSALARRTSRDASVRPTCPEHPDAVPADAKVVGGGRVWACLACGKKLGPARP